MAEDQVATIVLSDIHFCKTVVHLVDHVLTPPDYETFVPTNPDSEPCNSIVGRLGSLVGSVHFSILRRLLKKAGGHWVSLPVPG